MCAFLLQRSPLVVGEQRIDFEQDCGFAKYVQVRGVNDHNDPSWNLNWVRRGERTSGGRESEKIVQSVDLRFCWDQMMAGVHV